MTTVDRSEYLPEQSYAKLTRGEALRMTRELREWTQQELAHASGVSQAAISSIENGWIDLRLDRAEKLARALGIHPAVLAFPNWRGGPTPALRRSSGRPTRRRSGKT